MRALSSASAVTIAAAASLLLAPTAYANGDNGTVKIHDAVTDLEYDRRNNPKVCTFYLDGFRFDGRQSVDWQIVEMPPTGTKGKVAEVGELTLDEEGHLRSETLSLEDGHYKLVWNFAGEHGRAKHKVFRVDCDGVPEEVAEEVADPSPSTSSEPSPEPDGSGEPSSVPTEDAAGEEPSSQPSPSGGADLAETGSSVPAGALAAAAASMLGAGTYLVLRRRNSRSQQD